MSSIIQFVGSRKKQILSGVAAIGTMHVIPGPWFILVSSILIALVTFVSPDAPDLGDDK